MLKTDSLKYRYPSYFKCFNSLQQILIIPLWVQHKALDLEKWRGQCLRVTRLLREHFGVDLFLLVVVRRPLLSILPEDVIKELVF